MKHKETLWSDRKRNFLGLPWTFTKYALDEDRLFIDTGFFSQREDDVRLYRITDLTLTRSLWQRIIRTGTIHCDSADQTMKNFDIKNIRRAFDVKEMLSDLVEKSRRKNRVYMGENMNRPGMSHAAGMMQDDLMDGNDMRDGAAFDMDDMPCDDPHSH